MKDILLTPDGDLYVNKNGDISITDSTSQAVKIRLMWFLNEWKYNEGLGVPYYEEVLIKGFNKTHIEQIITEQILSVEGVLEVTKVDILVNVVDRKIKISFEANIKDEHLKDEVVLNA